jgi:hypothetical protein
LHIRQSVVHFSVEASHKMALTLGLHTVTIRWWLKKVTESLEVIRFCVSFQVSFLPLAALLTFLALWASPLFLSALSLFHL